MIFQLKRLMGMRFSRSGIAHMDLPSEELARLPEILSKWEKSTQKYLGMIRSQNMPHASLHTLPLPEKFQSKIKKIEQDPRFINAFGSRSYEFKLVELDKLVAYQEYVYMDFVQALSARLPEQLTEEDVFDYCITLDKDYSPVTRLRVDDSKFIFSSDSTDLRLLDVVPKQIQEVDLTSLSTGIPVKSLILLFGYGLPMVNAFVVGNRYFLSNGFHRLYALRLRGVEYAPMLIIKDASSSELSGMARNVPFEFIMKDNRPPMFQDFFDSELTVDIKEKPRRHAVRVKIETEIIDVPLG